MVQQYRQHLRKWELIKNETLGSIFAPNTTKQFYTEASVGYTLPHTITNDNKNLSLAQNKLQWRCELYAGSIGPSQCLARFGTI